MSLPCVYLFIQVNFSVSRYILICVLGVLLLYYLSPFLVFSNCAKLAPFCYFNHLASFVSAIIFIFHDFILLLTCIGLGFCELGFLS